MILSKSSEKTSYGFVHALYGQGKGKTSAAIGLAIRAAGCGLKVSFVQFMKDGKSNERKILESIPEIDYFCPGNHQWASRGKEMLKSQREHALSCMKYIFNLPEDKDLLICDEILNVPLYLDGNNKPLSYINLADYVRNKRPNLELVITGLYLPKNMVDLIDYASEIKEVKHPFKLGIKARPGIEF